MFCCFSLSSSVRLFANPWTAARQASLPMEFSRQEYRSRFPFPSVGNLPDSGIKPASPVFRADSLPLCHLGILVQACDGMLLSHERGQLAICNRVDRGHHAQCNKSEADEVCMAPLACGICKKQTRRETQLVVLT